MRVREFQGLVSRLYGARDAQRGIDLTATWLVEEVGEVATAVRHRDDRALAEELADVVAWAASLAALRGIDLEDALAAKYLFR